jgi:hypothetical protein
MIVGFRLKQKELSGFKRKPYFIGLKLNYNFRRDALR